MKNIMRLILLSLPLVVFSCFEFVGTGTARQTLSLALSAPGDVARLHIAVFEGVATPDQIIYQTSVAAGSSIPLDLPAGDNRIVTVWAEGYDGIANYFGSIGPITIDNSGNTPLPIRMIRFDNNAAGFNFTWDTKNGVFNWNAIPGALSYELGLLPIRSVTPIQVIVSGNSHQYPAGSAFTSITIRVVSSVFDLGSDSAAGIFI